MSRRVDSLQIYDHALSEAVSSNPWGIDAEGAPEFQPDLRLLERLLSIPLSSAKTSETGVFAKGVDAWLAHEFRRAGFEADNVWPRASAPRVLPRDIGILLKKLPRGMASDLAPYVSSIAAVTPADTKILGRAYEKQVDVAMSSWSRGPELMVSTKTQVSSFAKNIGNRFEEAYGDAANLRGRHPLAAVGFFFLQRSTVLTQEPDAFERTKDMMRKLLDSRGLSGYSSTGLALAQWDHHHGEIDVKIQLQDVPEDLRPGRFIGQLVRQVLAASPVDAHVRARELMEHRPLPLPES